MLPIYISFSPFFVALKDTTVPFPLPPPPNAMGREINKLTDPPPFLPFFLSKIPIFGTGKPFLAAKIVRNERRRSGCHQQKHSEGKNHRRSLAATLAATPRLQSSHPFLSHPLHDPRPPCPASALGARGVTFPGNLGSGRGGDSLIFPFRPRIPPFFPDD